MAPPGSVGSSQRRALFGAVAGTASSGIAAPRAAVDFRRRSAAPISGFAFVGASTESRCAELTGFGRVYLASLNSISSHDPLSVWTFCFIA